MQLTLQELIERMVALGKAQSTKIDGGPLGRIPVITTDMVKPDEILVVAGDQVIAHFQGAGKTTKKRKN